MRIDYSKLPIHMRKSTQRYIEEGLITQRTFLYAVATNDFAGAVCKADNINDTALREWALFFYNDVPANCWGSPEAVKAWSEQGGLNGIPDSTEE